MFSEAEFNENVHAMTAQGIPMQVIQDAMCEGEDPTRALEHLFEAISHSPVVCCAGLCYGLTMADMAPCVEGGATNKALLWILASIEVRATCRVAPLISPPKFRLRGLIATAKGRWVLDNDFLDLLPEAVQGAHHTFSANLKLPVDPPSPKFQRRQFPTPEDFVVQCATWLEDDKIPWESGVLAAVRLAYQGTRYSTPAVPNLPPPTSHSRQGGVHAACWDARREPQAR